MAKRQKSFFCWFTLVVVLIIALVVGLFYFHSEGAVEIEKQGNIEASKQILKLQEEIDELNKENEELKGEIKALEKINKETVVGPQDATHYQVLIDLSEIWGKYKNGEIENAKKSFEKISTSGFDDTALSFYESLRENLK